MDLLNKYDVVIFDCDGVLIDINLLKCEAFGKAVVGYPENAVNNFVEHCKRTFGVSRYIKFKEFLSDFVNEPFEQEKYNKMLFKYADICQQIYKQADITPGCINLISKLNIADKKLYVASGSDQNELLEVFRIRKLNTFFKAVYGSPKTKSQCTRDILNENLSEKAVFIGDSMSDLKAAKEHHIDFIYMSKFTVQSEEQDQICRIEAKMVINTLEDLITKI